MKGYGEYLPLDPPKVGMSVRLPPNPRYLARQAARIKEIRAEAAAGRSEFLGTHWSDRATEVADTASFSAVGRGGDDQLHRLCRAAAEKGVVLGLLARKHEAYEPGWIEPHVASILYMDATSISTSIINRVGGNEGVLFGLLAEWSLYAGYFVVVTETAVSELASQYHDDVAAVKAALFGDSATHELK